ncbi:MAG: hypothetical protein ACI4V1_02940 [Eubacteriales bacterium]
MNQENIKIFRSAIGGFNREDVTNYIREVDRKHADILEEITAHLEEANQKNKELSVKAEEDRHALDEIQQTNETLKETIRTLTAEREEAHRQADACRAETEKLNTMLAEANERLTVLDGEKQLLNEKIRSLEAELEKAAPEEDVSDPKDHSSPAYKLAMYDKISSQLGDILINANRNADDILSAAREEAEKLRLDTDLECEQKRSDCDSEVARVRTETAEEAAYIREHLSAVANSLLSSVSADLHGNIENCIREMNACMTDLQYELQTLTAKIASRSEEMNERISYYQGCVSEGIEERLSTMDEKYGIQKTAENAAQES